MAQIIYTKPVNDPYALVLTWLDVTESDTFRSYRLDRVVADLMIHASGTFGGASVALQGSFDNATWFALNDLDGSAIALTSTGHDAARTAPLWVRPNASGGSSQSLTVSVFVRHFSAT